MCWRVRWRDEDREFHTRVFYHSTTATRFVCETVERLPDSNITLERFVDDEDKWAKDERATAA